MMELIEKCCPFCGHKPCSIEMIVYPREENLSLIFCSFHCVQAYVEGRFNRAYKYRVGNVQPKLNISKE
jgi:hypothetical protein